MAVSAWKHLLQDQKRQQADDHPPALGLVVVVFTTCGVAQIVHKTE